MRPGLGLLRCFLTFLLSLSHPCSGVCWQGRFWRGEALGKPSGCDWDAAQDAAAFPGAPDSLSHPVEHRSHFALDLGRIPAQQLPVGVWGCLLGWVMSRCGAETGLLLWVTRKGENNPRTQSNCRKKLTKKKKNHKKPRPFCLPSAQPFRRHVWKMPRGSALQIHCGMAEASQVGAELNRGDPRAHEKRQGTLRFGLLRVGRPQPH